MLQLETPPAPTPPPEPLPAADNKGRIHELEQAGASLMGARKILEEHVGCFTGPPEDAAAHLARTQGFFEGVAYMMHIYLGGHTNGK